MSLDSNKNYYNYQILLSNDAYYTTENVKTKQKWHSTYKDFLLKDYVFRMVFASVNFDINHIFPGRWTSMCLEERASDIRLRPMCSDEFLIKAQESKLKGEKYIVFACIKIENKKLYFVCSSEHFTNYCFSTSSSNSFIRFNYSDLVKWASEPNQIRIKNRSIKSKGNQPVYHFWTGTDADTNLKTLEYYLNVYKYIKNANYAVLNRIKQSGTRIEIPVKIREIVEMNYDNVCALVKKCTCENYDLGEKVWLRLSKHQHHIVPEEWFIAQNNRDSDLINNINNIVLLCENCHHNLHGSNDIKKKATLDNLIKVIKETKKYDQFIDYLQNELKITLPILYGIYGVDYE